jgi:hypothetical protein
MFLMHLGMDLTEEPFGELVDLTLPNLIGLDRDERIVPTFRTNVYRYRAARVPEFAVSTLGAGTLHPLTEELVGCGHSFID